MDPNLFYSPFGEAHKLEMIQKFQKLKSEAIQSFLELYKEGKPAFRIDDMARMHERTLLLNSPESYEVYKIEFRDFLGQPKEEHVGRPGMWLVQLFSFKEVLERLQKPRNRDEAFFYYPGRRPSDPATEKGNLTLKSSMMTLELDPIHMEGSRKVEVIFRQAKRCQTENEFYTHYLWPKVKDVLSHIGYKNIDRIICFEFGTLEADVQGLEEWKPRTGPLSCAAHHHFAFSMRNYIQSKTWERERPRLIFQNIEYTDATASFLQEKKAEVVRDNVGGFQLITERSIVIWMGTHWPIPVPVKQVVADFPYQRPKLPLPRVMIWPEEGNQPTTLEDMVSSTQLNDDTGV
ncbi:hypothetical protein F5Y14DRAFT_448610 [Nemania sp. NC0429]|nr:hypothetical protein F5Y14DRAFT_448610 [Nemania sp. NC0429]